MTKEELKEMVDSTINANGSKEITGQALNLALNAIIESMGGSAARRLYVPFDDDELSAAALASNAALYGDLKTAIENQEPCPAVYAPFTRYDASGQFSMTGCGLVSYGLDGDDIDVIAVVIPAGEYIIFPDGSVSIGSGISLNTLSHV